MTRKSLILAALYVVEHGKMKRHDVHNEVLFRAGTITAVLKPSWNGYILQVMVCQNKKYNNAFGIYNCTGHLVELAFDRAEESR